jgi:hypothetical protein
MVRRPFIALSFLLLLGAGFLPGAVYAQADFTRAKT